MTDNSYVLSLFGTSMPSASATMPAVAAYKKYVQNEPQEIAKYAAKPTTEQSVDYFKAQIKKITSADQLTKDPKLLQFITTAFGLEADAQYPAKIREVLNSDVTDTNSFANRLVDPRYKAMAAEFNVQATGMTMLQSDAVISDVVNKYVTNSYEKSLDSINPSLREASYFLRNIGNVTDTYQILGDAVLRSVITQTLHLPAEIANQDVAKQKSLIDAQLDITKFETTPPSGTSAAATPLGTAQADQASVTTARAAVTAAQTAVQSIADSIQSIQDDYARLANIQDPGGHYAAEIPIQQAAAPQLVREQGLLTAAQGASGSITSDISRMGELVQLATDPANAGSLADYKTEFADLRTKISAAVTGATSAYDNGTSGASYTDENLLNGTVTSPLSVQYDATGDVTSVRGYDLSASSSFQTTLDAAGAAFQGVTGSGDGTSLAAAASALATAKSASDAVGQTLNVDAARFSADIASVPQWAATLNTAGLYPGAEAVRDAGSRVTDINQLLGQVHDIATQSNQRADSADRSDLTAQYSDLLTQLGTLINTPNSSVDNLLAGGDQSYALTDTSSIKAHGQDLNSSVLAALSAGDLSSSTGASAVLVQLDGAVKDTMSAAAKQIGNDSQVFSLAADTLDPRAAVDSAYRKLATDLPGLVASAASGSTNLLDELQSSLSLSLGSIGQVFQVAPLDNFDTDVTQIIGAGSQLLPSDGADTSGALGQLENARFNVARVLGQLNSSMSQLDFAGALVGQKVIDLTTQNNSSISGEPINATIFAYQFVQKYLAVQDASSSTGSSGGQSYLLPLFTTSA
jgi:thermostable 8-oxoguanine DNA glycosylase